MATIRSSSPEAETSTPVRCGRVSSREAARATRLDRLDERLGRNRDAAVAAGLGQLREVLGRKGAQVEPRAARDDLDVLLARAVLEREVVLGQRADDVEQQPAGQDHRGPSRSTLASDLDADTELHVGGLELDAGRPRRG